jgi:hypothetical protein
MSARGRPADQQLPGAAGIDWQWALAVLPLPPRIELLKPDVLLSDPPTMELARNVQ